jgi:peptidoglycan DL-endopeptidase CwlO
VSFGAGSAALADPGGGIASKQAQAQSIIGQIGSLENQVSAAIERWNLANVRLGQINRNLQRSQFELGVAKTNYKRAQLALAKQALEVYTSGQSDSTVAVILGASSLDDLLNRIDSVSRVNDQRATVVGDVKTFRATIAEQTANLHDAESQQKQVVAQRAAEKASIQSQLAERQQLLQSVRAEIVRLQAEERARQARIAAEVRARLAARPPVVTALNVAASAPAANPAQQVTAVAGAATAAAPAAQAATPAPAPAPAPIQPQVQPSSQYAGVVGIAMRYLGTPYVWGGASPSGFDCSGLVMYVFSQVGVSLPHSSYAQYGAGVAVSRDQLQPGDLVFFDGLGHVGIYIGGGQFIHAPHTGDVVKISSLTGWYASTYVGARRIL